MNHTVPDLQEPVCCLTDGRIWANTLKEKAAKNGYVVEVVAEGEHYDYLARIAKKIC